MVTDALDDLMHLAKQVAGIDLADSKRAMVGSRVAKRVRALGIGIADYARRCHEDPAELAHMVDLLTTNHTAWLREPAHFGDLAQRVLPALARAGGGRRRLRIWCAAAATGEEPYTIALTVRRTLPDLAAWDAAILATDISRRALAKARAGVYPAARVADLAEADRALALEAADVDGERCFRVRGELRALLAFAQLNLMGEWPMRGPFDAIFCRNVMIYFDTPTKQRLVGRLARLLAPGGTLYVGHAESLSGLDHPLRTLGTAIYAAP